MSDRKFSPEPARLRRGKKFQELVQADYNANSKGGGVGIEASVDYQGISQKGKGNRGRMDIVVEDDENGYVMIMEIKATDWDNIKPANIQRNLYRHGRQLHKYVNKFLEIDDKTVGLALIYPEPPVKEGLREQIEQIAMDLYSFPVYWYSEIRTEKTS